MPNFLRRTLAAALALGLSGLAIMPTRADEGLWTFDNPPLKQLKEKYNFSPSKEWFDHVRLSSVRLNDGGSGSFVSPNGLIMTNHHVAESQLAKLSTPDRDLNQLGFYAARLEDEAKCPDLEINVLISIEDMTARVQAAAKGAPDANAANERRNAEIAKIEKESSDKTGLRSDIINLYNGGEYWLYRFKKYTDVRMVFAPERQIAFFGGDPDNFTYPRYNLDVAFLRIYENDKPLKTEHYLRWSEKGAADGELIFISGNPGNTDRLLTVAQLEYFRNVANPLRLKTLKRRRQALIRYGQRSPEAKRQAESVLFGLENGLKAVSGYQEGLLDPKVMEKKKQEEGELRQRIGQNAELQKSLGGAFDEIAAAYAKLPQLNKRQTFSSIRGSRIANQALGIIRYVAEVQKPNDERLEEYRETNLESLKFGLLSPAPLYPAMEEEIVTETLQESLEELGPEDPFIKTVLRGKSPAEVAKEIIGGTKVNDPAFRKALLEGGAAAVNQSTDPLVVLLRKVDPLLRELRATFERDIESVETAAGEKIGKARFAIYGKSISPDATFSLRLSYGVVKGYELGTTYVPYKTTYGGLYDRAASFDFKPPFDLPKRVIEKRNAVNLDTPFNFVCTADTIGGNSGSPIINRNAEVVGILFDGNIQSLVWQYSFTEEVGRSVGVHSAGIMEGLRKIYEANRVVDEILSK